METKYDVVIVGAGPAGLSCAREINPSSSGISVLVVDQRKKVGSPVQCGEGLPSFHQNTGPVFPKLPAGLAWPSPGKLEQTSCVTRPIHGMYLVSPRGHDYYVPGAGQTIRRERLDNYLADGARAHGVEVATETKYTDSLTNPSAGTYQGVTIRHPNGETEAITCKILVDASGHRAAVARNTHRLEPPKNVCSAIYAHVEGRFHRSEISIYLDPKFGAGYGWIFPQGYRANIGYSPATPWAPCRRDILDAFIDHIVGVGQERKYGGGRIPLGGLSDRLVAGPVAVVGDAAGMVFASNGGGIGPAIVGGKLLGRAVVRTIRQGIPLEDYERQVRRYMGQELAASVRAKRWATRLRRHPRLFEAILRLGGPRAIRWALHI